MVNPKKLGQIALPPLQPDHVLVRMLAAPVNPSDINAIQGVYPVPLVPATCVADNTPVSVPGFEGVAEVVAIGDRVAYPHAPQLGDWVIPNTAGFGTWRAHAVVPATDVAVVRRAKSDSPLHVAAAASLSVNPTTAYRLLRDFAHLNEGDTVVQNAGNSAVGRYVIQLARSMGVRTVNLVRDRADLDSLAADLTKLGATAVLRDGTGELRAYMRDQSVAAKVAFNSVGGKSATELLRALGPGGTHVTYGAMAREPMAVPASLLIFKDVRIRGFWMTEWKKRASVEERDAMMRDLVDKFASGELVTPHLNEIAVPAVGEEGEDEVEKVVQAIAEAGTGYLGKKQMLVFAAPSHDA
ncbi:hypothetical protein GGF31_006321 [Allomyces arbusculus]|nr:hypothetical protein GGF31_006321 [Allomyces arbusculus]